MSNSSTLNLVQRAMLQGLEPAPQHVAPDFPAMGKPPEAHGLLDRSRLAGNERQIEAPPSAGQEVHLNHARCREDGILSPGNTETETHNEFRIIKRRLLLALKDAERTPEDGPPKVLITSALPAEGKTFTALNVALALAAERDLQVLLIEGDVINPALSRYFVTAKARQGLTDLLNGNIDRPEAVMHSCAGVPNLRIIFAGAPDPRTPELMASPRLPEIFAQLHAAYPELLVVIDCSPTISPEPAAMASHVDHAIMVVAADQASRLQLQEALDQIAACPRISLVFNKSPRWRKKGTYYGYGYQYGAKASAQPEASSDFGSP